MLNRTYIEHCRINKGDIFTEVTILWLLFVQQKAGKKMAQSIFLYIVYSFFYSNKTYLVRFALISINFCTSNILLKDEQNLSLKRCFRFIVMMILYTYLLLTIFIFSNTYVEECLNVDAVLFIKHKKYVKPLWHVYFSVLLIL
jgi:hypothetical protein